MEQKLIKGFDKDIDNSLLKTLFIRKFFLISFFSFLHAELFSRAGGGGHSGGSSGGHSLFNSNHNESNEFIGYIFIIGLSAVGIYAILLTYFHFIKSNKSKKILEKANSYDSLWNLIEMKNHTFNVFCKMQVAWENRMLGNVKPLISKGLYEELDNKIKVLRHENKKNILENIIVNQITFISCIDFKDNSKDSYIAQIDGTMIDYIVNDRNNLILENNSKEATGFTDHYQFIRIENKWILNQINNDPNIFNLIDSRNYFEK